MLGPPPNPFQFAHLMQFIIKRPHEIDRQWLATGWPRVNKLTAAAGTDSERRKKEEEERGVKVIMLR